MNLQTLVWQKRRTPSKRSAGDAGFKQNQEALTKSIAQADEILAKTPDYYEALDAKGLALSGLTICDLRLKIDDRRQTVDNGQPTTDYRQQAIETFRKARKIAPHAGVVKSVLRLFDELVKCDQEGVLKDVRKQRKALSNFRTRRS